MQCVLVSRARSISQSSHRSATITLRDSPDVRGRVAGEGGYNLPARQGSPCGSGYIVCEPWGRGVIALIAAV